MSWKFLTIFFPALRLQEFKFNFIEHIIWYQFQSYIIIWCSLTYAYCPLVKSTMMFDPHLPTLSYFLRYITHKSFAIKTSFFYCCRQFELYLFENKRGRNLCIHWKCNKLPSKLKFLCSIIYLSILSSNCSNNQFIVVTFSTIWS